MWFCPKRIPLSGVAFETVGGAIRESRPTRVISLEHSPGTGLDCIALHSRAVAYNPPDLARSSSQQPRAGAHVRRLVALSGAGIEVRGDRKPAIDRLASRVVRRMARHVVGARQGEFEVFTASDLEWTALRPPLVTVGEARGYRLDLQLAPGARPPRGRRAALLDQVVDHRFLWTAPIVPAARLTRAGGACWNPMSGLGDGADPPLTWTMLPRWAPWPVWTEDEARRVRPHLRQHAAGRHARYLTELGLEAVELGCGNYPGGARTGVADR